MESTLEPTLRCAKQTDLSEVRQFYRAMCCRSRTWSSIGKPLYSMWGVRLDASMLTYFEVDAGVRFETHQHEGEQITTVVEGALFFETPDGTVRVAAGEVIAIPAGIPHAVFTREQGARAFDAWSAPFPD